MSPDSYYYSTYISCSASDFTSSYGNYGGSNNYPYYSSILYTTVGDIGWDIDTYEPIKAEDNGWDKE